MKAGIVKHVVGLKLAERGIPTLVEAARRLGISKQYLCNLLHGRVRTAIRQQQIADLCGCPPMDLFGEWTHPSLGPRRRRAAS